MLAYPEFEVLKRLYPTVGVRVLKPVFQSEGSLTGYMLISNQVHSEYHFRGADFDDLYHNILRTHHFVEQRSPSSLNKVASTDDVDNLVDSIVSDAKTNKVWVINDDLVERYRVPLNQVRSYVDRGFEVGRRSFATWVEQSKIDSFAAKNRADNVEKLKQLAISSGKLKDTGLTRSDYKGCKRMLAPDGKQYRVLSADIKAREAEGWKFVGTPDKVSPVKSDRKKGEAMIGTRWVINNKTRAKQRLPADQAERLVAKGDHSFCGARTR